MDLTPKDTQHGPRSGRADAMRLTTLFSTSTHQGLDRLTRLAARFLRAPVAMVNLFHGDRMICHSVADRSGRYRVGATTPLESSVCHRMLQADTPFLIPDAREDARLNTLPSVAAGQVVGYLGVPLFTEDGTPLGSLCVMDAEPRPWTSDDLDVLSDLAASVVAEIELRVDVVLRRAAENELASTNRRLRIVLDESAIGIALVDLTGHVLETNPALERMLGYAPGELGGMSFSEVTHPDDLALDWGLFAELARGDRSHYQIEKRYLRKDGEILWGRVTVSAARDEEGRPLTVLGMVEDLTEHRQLEVLQERVRVLEGLLPICMFCKDIRNESDHWERLETYIGRRYEATFTHGCCPDCAREHFGEVVG